MATDDELSRLAEQALLREAQRGAQRAQISGPSGWLRCRLPSTNKTFLQNTLLGALASNRVKERQEKSRCESGKRRRQLEEKERNTYKRVYLQASTKTKQIPQKKVESKQSSARNEGKDKERDQVFMWTESGLQLTNNSKKTSNSKGIKSKDTTNKKNSPSTSILSRKIKFIPGNDSQTEDEKR